MAKSKYPTHVKPRFEEIYEWASKGLTDYQIYHNLNIGKNAFYQYLFLYKEFKDLLTRARTKAEEVVENDLFKMCTGYPYWEEVCVKVKHKEYSDDGKLIREYETLETKSVQKYSESNVTAIQFYLTNRSKDKWKNNPANYELKKQELALKEKQDLGDW